MAAPTAVKVESTATDTIVVSWTYGGASSVKVYRSLDDISYSVIATVLVGTLTYTDDTLTASTLYYYKLSDDNGATFSATKHATTQTCDTGEATKKPTNAALPRAGKEVTPAMFNDLATKLEISQKVTDNVADCVVCIVDGAITIDCATCDCTTIYVTEDITSITLQNCSKKCCFELIVAEGATFTICGFPASFGFDKGNDSCSYTITGGPGGSKYRFTSHQHCDADSGTGNGGPAGLKPLSITCEATDTGAVGCEIKCDSNPALNDHQVHCIANGGQAPYTWSTTKGLIWTNTGARLLCAAGKQAPNTIKNDSILWASCPHGSCPGGFHSSIYDSDTAFQSWYKYRTQNGGPGECKEADIERDVACDGTIGLCNSHFPPDAGLPNGASYCITGSTFDCTVTAIGPGFPPGDPCNFCDEAGGTIVDVRTAVMKAAGCCPCKIGAGAVVTVTDALHQSVSVVITDVGA